jgi:hypothetical protein
VDQFQGLAAALGHTQEQTHAQRTHLGLIKHLQQ